ncbi:MAG: IS630 family transposase [Candidatus Cloacimonadaceae bacterium]|nr:IS630 family transposase [Candidatus Cloacimonadaceae bacterium]
MGKPSKRAKLAISKTELEELLKVKNSRTEAHARVTRANMLFAYHDGRSVTEIAKSHNTNRPKVERTINRALGYGLIKALDDLPRPGRKPKITDDAKAWVVSLACNAPKNYGYAAETWTYSALVRHISTNCVQEGFGCLSNIGKSALHGILTSNRIKPHKLTYYMEKRDPQFEEKMANVLCVYKEVEIINNNPDIVQTSVTVSYDEKPGIQAIANVGAQLAPVPGEYPNIGRDPEYKRLGTVSLLAGINLHDGKVYPIIRERHRSREFIEFLNMLDKEIPAHLKIRIILDNHSAHVSKETKTYLLTKPNRFEFVFTPKHGSWLNLIEMFFSKIARSLLRFIRVQTKEELIDRIYKGIEEINQAPVVYRWRYKMDEITL